MQAKNPDQQDRTTVEKPYAPLKDDLPPDESEQSYRIDRLTDLAADIFGSIEEVSSRLKEPYLALNSRLPVDLRFDKKDSSFIF